MAGSTEAINIICLSKEQAGIYKKKIRSILIELYGHEGITYRCDEAKNEVNSYSGNIKIETEDSSLPYLSIRVPEYALDESWDIFYELFKTICNKLEPLYAQFGGYDLDFPVHASFVEYYRDPYFFCVDPVKSEDRFFHLKGNQIQLTISKAKKLISKGELLSLIKKHSVDSFETLSGGFGCLKIESELKQGMGASFVYPRYFIRKELKKRGLKIEDGLPEKYARELGIK